MKTTGSFAVRRECIGLGNDSTADPMVSVSRRWRNRWFIRAAGGLLLFLFLSILLAGLILLLQERRPRFAVIIGNSMEPTLRGPSLQWSCSKCQARCCFAVDSIIEGLPIRCPQCQAWNDGLSFQDSLSTELPWIQGDKVQYYSRNTVVSKRRATHPEAENHRGLKRGDLLVLKDSEDAESEVKRLVAFPGESLRIWDGDLWIQNRRWTSSLDESLKRAVLLSYDSAQADAAVQSGTWQGFSSDRAFPTHRLSASSGLEPEGVATIAFVPLQSSLISNEFLRNAHEKIAPIPVNDVGLALQIGSTSIEWQLVIRMRSAKYEQNVTFDWADGSLSINVLDQEFSIPFLVNQENSWLMIYLCDGYCMIGNAREEIARIALEGLDPEGDLLTIEETTEPIRIECKLGSIEIPQKLVFRDVHYRGYLDASEQVIDSSGGYIVLGDNVSLSIDSRQRWSSGIKWSSIRGIIVEQRTGLEHLISQRP